MLFEQHFKPSETGIFVCIMPNAVGLQQQTSCLLCYLHALYVVCNFDQVFLNLQDAFLIMGYLMLKFWKPFKADSF